MRHHLYSIDVKNADTQYEKTDKRPNDPRRIPWLPVDSYPPFILKIILPQIGAGCDIKMKGIKEKRDKRAAHQKEYNQKNKEKIAAYQKEYYQKNKDKRKEYYQKNKDKINKK